MRFYRFISVFLSLLFCLSLLAACRSSVLPNTASEGSSPASSGTEDESGPVEPGPDRLTPEGTFLPPEDWTGGELFPYPALYPYWIMNADGRAHTSDYILYGLADKDGRIVTDPYFSDFKYVAADDGTRLLFLKHDTVDPIDFLKQVYMPDGLSYIYSDKGEFRAPYEMMVMAGDGSWRSPFLPEGGSILCYAGENRIIWQPYGGRTTLYTTEGDTIAFSREVSVAAYPSEDSLYGINPFFSAGWLPVCISRGAGVAGQYNYVDPDGSFLFAEDRLAVNDFDEKGYAAVVDPQTKKSGIIDRAGNYTVKPVYEHLLLPGILAPGLYAYTAPAENDHGGLAQGLLRADTGEILFPPLFYDCGTDDYAYPYVFDDPPEADALSSSRYDPFEYGEIWLTKDINPYPYSLTTGERLSFPEVLRDEFGRQQYWPLARGWYYFFVSVNSGNPDTLVLFRRESPEDYITVNEQTTCLSVAYDADRDELLVFAGDRYETDVRTIVFAPESGERIDERSLDYYYRKKLEDGLYEVWNARDRSRKYIDLDFNEAFPGAFRRVTPLGGGLYAAETYDVCGLIRRDGSWLLRIPAAERYVLIADSERGSGESDSSTDE